MNNVTTDDGDGMSHQHHEGSRSVRPGTTETLMRTLCSVFAAAARILFGLSVSASAHNDVFKGREHTVRENRTRSRGG